jgi:hypothetical protein
VKEAHSTRPAGRSGGEFRIRLKCAIRVKIRNSCTATMLFFHRKEPAGAPENAAFAPPGRDRCLDYTVRIASRGKAARYKRSSKVSSRSPWCRA